MLSPLLLQHEFLFCHESWNHFQQRNMGKTYYTCQIQLTHVKQGTSSDNIFQLHQWKLAYHVSFLSVQNCTSGFVGCKYRNIGNCHNSIWLLYTHCMHVRQCSHLIRNKQNCLLKHLNSAKWKWINWNTYCSLSGTGLYLNVE